MRIHGDKVIKRRSGLEQRSDYHEYLPELREDFKCMCGYCGKTERVTKNAFEIDHFVPKNMLSFEKMIIAIWYIRVMYVIEKVF